VWRRKIAKLQRDLVPRHLDLATSAKRRDVHQMPNNRSDRDGLTNAGYDPYHLLQPLTGLPFPGASSAAKSEGKAYTPAVSSALNAHLIQHCLSVQHLPDNTMHKHGNALGRTSNPPCHGVAAAKGGVEQVPSACEARAEVQHSNLLFLLQQQQQQHQQQQRSLAAMGLEFQKALQPDGENFNTRNLLSRSSAYANCLSAYLREKIHFAQLQLAAVSSAHEMAKSFAIESLLSESSPTCFQDSSINTCMPIPISISHMWQQKAIAENVLGRARKSDQPPAQAKNWYEAQCNSVSDDASSMQQALEADATLLSSLRHLHR